MKEKSLNSYFKEGHLQDEALALFADALLLNKVESLPLAIRNHVEDCQQCKIEIMALYEIMLKDSVIQNNISHPYLDNFEEIAKISFKRYSFLKIAAAFLLLIGLGSIIYYGLINQMEPNELVIQNIDTVKTHKENILVKEKTDSISKKPLNKTSSHTLIAQNMQESVMFESLIASNYRGNDIEVMAPANKQRFKTLQPIKFKFNGDLTIPVNLLIYNNKGIKKYTKENITENNFSLTIKLLPGLYYWKIEKENSLIYVGKFIVK